MTITTISSATKEVKIGFDQPFVIIGERINPTGRKILAEEMKVGDYSRVEADALAQVAAGAQMLDVNAGIPLADEPRILAEAITLRDIAAKMIEVNVMLQSVNGLITDANETVVDEGDTMISENAEWADGSVAKQMTKATPNANSQSVVSNTERLQKLLERANIAEKEATGLVHRVEDDTKGILELGDDIANRRERIQADRERVVANQRRTADLLIKLK